jgi:hypothetical protein
VWTPLSEISTGALPGGVIVPTGIVTISGLEMLLSGISALKMVVFVDVVVKGQIGDDVKFTLCIPIPARLGAKVKVPLPSSLTPVPVKTPSPMVTAVRPETKPSVAQ